MTFATSTLRDVSYHCYNGVHHECKKELPDCICPCHGECSDCGCASHVRHCTGSYLSGSPCECEGGFKTIYPGWREEG